jgi:Asp-tRNA(Asn)/Glu-tRNA(Gln) amidotransferase A subunit family amidase
MVQNLKITGLPFSIVFFLFACATSIESDISTASIEQAQKIIGLNFTRTEQDSMSTVLMDQRKNYEHIRSVEIFNSDEPAIRFDPIPPGFVPRNSCSSIRWSVGTKVQAPTRLEDVAFYSITQLAELIRTRKITSLQLTQMYLLRLKKYGPKLECVITLTESLAIAQAKRADAELAAGKYRGLLHGIPYGAKDLLAVKNYPTSWGIGLYKNRIIPKDATVIQRLEQAGAVLVAKLTLGELAMDDVWFGGKTRNPWNLKQGSSGSSAGSAAATSAGLVGFAIGSETWGSIVSPATRCGVTGLRPTFGRVSRYGAMTLSWSMDKLGPICRTVEDCAIVLNAIYGPDGKDKSVYNYPFSYSPVVDWKKLRIGVLTSDFDSLKNNKDLHLAVLETLKKLGATLVPIEMPNYPINDLAIILSAECASAFDDLTRSNKDDSLKQQAKDSWPNSFRSARFIPAVEYLQANRIRKKLIADMQTLMKSIDLYVVPSFSDNLLLTNLTGHPCVVVPDGFTKEGTPTSISFIGRLFDEGTLMSVAKAYQDATGFHLKHPSID